MTTKDEALKQALDAITRAMSDPTDHLQVLGRAADACREALSYEPKPAAWIHPGHLKHACKYPFMCRVEPTQRIEYFIPIYTK